MIISYAVRFWLYLIFVIPSALCSIFNLYYFLADRQLRTALNNHVIIVVLFLGLLYDLTDIVWFIHHYRTGYTLSPTYTFCVIWAYIDYAPFAAILLLVAWASIERHILVFHQNLVATKTRSFLIHYLPLCILSIYPFIYYTIVFFVLPCDVEADFTQRRCSLDYCAFAIAALGMWDDIAHNIVPIFTIVVFSIALILRVWYSKYRMGQRFQWRNYKRMVVQLLSVSTVYFVLYFPTIIVHTVSIARGSIAGMLDYFSVGYYLCYFVILLTPFVCTLSLPELRRKIRQMTPLCRRGRRSVVPEILTLNPLTAGRTGRPPTRVV